MVREVKKLRSFISFYFLWLLWDSFHNVSLSYSHQLLTSDHEINYIRRYRTSSSNVTIMAGPYAARKWMCYIHKLGGYFGMYLASEPEIQFWFVLLIQIHCQSVMNRVNPLHQRIWYLVYAVLQVQTGFSQVSQTLQATWTPGLKMKLRKMWNCLPLLQLPLLSKTCQFQGAVKTLMWSKVTHT